MSAMFQISLLAFFCIVPFYLHAFFSFFRIVSTERPEWLRVRGSLSSLYDGLSRAGDPNVQVELLRIAFGARARELHAPKAGSLARRIRVLLPMGLILFIVGVVGAIAG